MFRQFENIRHILPLAVDALCFFLKFVHELLPLNNLGIETVLDRFVFKTECVGNRYDHDQLQSGTIDLHVQNACVPNAVDYFWPNISWLVILLVLLDQFIVFFKSQRQAVLSRSAHA